MVNYNFDLTRIKPIDLLLLLLFNVIYTIFKKKVLYDLWSNGYGEIYIRIKIYTFIGLVYAQIITISRIKTKILIYISLKTILWICTYISMKLKSNRDFKWFWLNSIFNCTGKFRRFWIYLTFLRVRFQFIIMSFKYKKVIKYFNNKNVGIIIIRRSVQ